MRSPCIGSAETLLNKLEDNTWKGFKNQYDLKLRGTQTKEETLKRKRDEQTIKYYEDMVKTVNPDLTDDDVAAAMTLLTP